MVHEAAGLGVARWLNWLVECARTVPDSLTEVEHAQPALDGEHLWKRVLTGGDSPPRIYIGKSHQEDSDLSVMFDMDAFVADTVGNKQIKSSNLWT